MVDAQLTWCNVELGATAHECRPLFGWSALEKTLKDDNVYAHLCGAAGANASPTSLKCWRRL